MKTPYRFTKRASCPYYQVTFRHIPNRWFSTGATTLAEAVQFAENKMHEVTTRKADITLREFAKDFFKPSDPQKFRKRLASRGNVYDESFYEQHQARLDNYILKKMGSYLLTSIRATMIEDFLLDLPNIANNTKNKILSCYRHVLTEAVRQGYIDHNPADDVTQLPNNYEESRPFTVLELSLMFPEDDNQLIELWSGQGLNDGLMWAVYFLIQKDTGWRPCEVSALQKINYYPEFRGIYTENDVNYKTHEIQPRIKTSKRGQRYKNGFLSERTDNLVRQLIAFTPHDGLFEVRSKYSNHRKNDHIKYIYSDIANDKLRTVCSKVNVKLDGRTQYSFRHTFSTQAFGNIPEQARLLLMGHTSLRQEYNHLTPEETLSRVAKLLEK